jgi:hypothetical protein
MQIFQIIIKTCQVHDCLYQAKNKTKIQQTHDNNSLLIFGGKNPSIYLEKQKNPSTYFG